MRDALPQRCMLNEGTIEYLLSARFDDPDDWLKRIPMSRRQFEQPAAVDQLASESFDCSSPHNRRHLKNCIFARRCGEQH